MKSWSRPLRAVLVDEQCWLDREIRAVQSRAASHISGITDIEYEALLDIALGLTDRAIARRRYLSERGVQNRLRELYAKLGIDLEQVVDVRWGRPTAHDPGQSQWRCREA